MPDYDAKQEAVNQVAEKNSPHKAIPEILAYMQNEGISLDDIKTFQGNQHEVTSEKEIDIRPSELDGLSNIPAKTNEQLTAELAELTRRFNNLNAAHFSQTF